ncbi:MAG TPA: S41 family peptidase [Chloroflexota bacterium]|nr:S41 family peptidase [Chloroflexota bacterium]
MRFRWQRGIVAALLVALLPWIGAPAAPASAAPSAQLAPGGHGVRAVEQGLTFLLDRYATPLDAAALLQAGWVGLVESPAAEPLKTQLAAVGSAPISGDRPVAWAEFQQRFDRLLAAGGDPDALAQAANRAMARSLDDCHTRFAPNYEKELASYDGGERYGGIGASALDAYRFDPRPPGPVIVGLVEDGPAASAGIRLGDAVIGVDDVDVKGWPNARVVELVRGAPGSVVRLRLDRPRQAEPVVVEVERAEIQSTLLESRLLDEVLSGDGSPLVADGTVGALGPIGYVQLKSFVRSIEPELPKMIDELHEQGARAWVLDLRNNGGGSVPTFAAVASLFIKDGTLGVTTDRNGSESIINTVRVGHREFAQPLAVLVNSLSASASELLAADLQEYGAGRVFGETTAGCFGNSQLFRLPDGSAMWITVRALQSGLERRDVHKLGVTPDEIVPRSREDLAAGRDPQLEAALTWLAASSAARDAAAQN